MTATHAYCGHRFCVLSSGGSARGCKAKRHPLTDCRRSRSQLPLVLMERRATVASPFAALWSLAIGRPFHVVGIASTTYPVDVHRLVRRKPLQLGEQFALHTGKLTGST